MPDGRSGLSRVSALALVFLLAHASPSSAGAWETARPEYHFTFPADYGAHESSRNEWWYYTGNLRDRGGRRFGFELTLFRYGVQHPLPGGSAWDIDDLYFAHFAVTDVSGAHFLSFDQVGRAALGYAGATVGDERAWIGDWRVERLASGEHRVRAAALGATIDLRLEPQKRAVIHGRNGVSRKGACPGCASHYYSFTRLRASGSLTIEGRAYGVTGSAWNDHEWGSNELGSGIVGWDWFSMQLDGGVDVMLYRLRRSDGSTVLESSGTLVSPDGTSRYLRSADFRIAATGAWTSPHDGARYPSGWIVSLSQNRARLRVTPLLDDQELITRKSTNVAYWEGACAISGSLDGRQVHGVGYTELTGYAPGGLGALR